MVKARPVATRIIEHVDATRNAAIGIGITAAAATHAMPHRERRNAIAAVVVEQKGSDAVLLAVHLWAHDAGLRRICMRPARRRWS